MVLTVWPPLNVAGIVMVLPNAWLLSGPVIYRCGLPLDPPENEEAASSIHRPPLHNQSSHADTPGVDVNQLKVKQELLYLGHRLPFEGCAYTALQPAFSAINTESFHEPASQLQFTFSPFQSASVDSEENLRRSVLELRLVALRDDEHGAFNQLAHGS